MSKDVVAGENRRSAIGGETRLVGVMGWPVAHSLSPAMHNAAFAATGLDYVYVPLPVPPEQLPQAMGGLAALGFVGANVTVPHKSAILPHVAALTPIARAIGAANTLIVQPDGTLLGDNTDGAGFLADLRAHGVDPAARSALVIGAGGAARAVVYALAEVGARVAVANRTLEKARVLCQIMRQALPHADVSAHAFPAALPELAQAADLIVNCTSLGLRAECDALPWDASTPFRSEQVVYDLVYTTRTPFLKLAAEGGARTIGGLGMLIHQGAKAFELWTRQPAPVRVMQAAIAQPFN